MSLFTDHDKYHIHKIMGFGCLSHYAYRIGCKMLYGSMLFSNDSIVTYVTPLAHLSLSLSSLIFHVPTYRFNSKVIIWKELQLHNIIFTSRSVFMMYHTLLMKTTNPYYYYVRLAIVMAHHYAADFVSGLYIEHTDTTKTTTRDIPYSMKPLMEYATKNYYAISQLIATYSMLRSTNYDNGLLIMFPIQASTFLMTLVRKNIVSNDHFHIIYALSLATPYLANIRSYHTNNIEIYHATIFVVMRLFGQLDKYLNMLGLHFIYTSIF